MRSILLLLPALLLLSACTRYSYTCHNKQFNFRFAGFDAADVDTIIVRQYLHGTMTSARPDYLFTAADYPNTPTRVGDTLLTACYAPSDSFDIALFVPAVNKTYALTEVTNEPPRTVSGKAWWADKLEMDCTNEVLSYKLDGVLIKPERSYNSTMNVTLRR